MNRTSNVDTWFVDVFVICDTHRAVSTWGVLRTKRKLGGWLWCHASTSPGREETMLHFLSSWWKKCSPKLPLGVYVLYSRLCSGKALCFCQSLLWLFLFTVIVLFIHNALKDVSFAFTVGITLPLQGVVMYIFNCVYLQCPIASENIGRSCQ